MCRISSLTCSKHFVANFVLWGASGGGLKDYAGEFGARDPGESGLMLVFAPDLEEVEEVGCGSVDGD
jgi:hypothetical protein